MWTSEVGLQLLAMRAGSLCCVALACGLPAHALANIAALPAPELGLRGRRRRAARAASTLFAASEPLVRCVGGWFARVPVGELREAWQLRLRQAGDLGGLSADELLAITALLGVLAASLCWWLGLSLHHVLFCTAIGVALPYARVNAVADRRALELERSLPVAMDLVVLCMGAGGDFPGALAFVVAELGEAHGACREELAQVQEQLALGRTRVEALASMAERTPSVAVRDLIAAITQSEQKGTPLVDTLTNQARSLRMHRSVRAEEAAARAGVKLMLPMLMMVSGIMLILLGPFFVNGMGF